MTIPPNRLFTILGWIVFILGWIGILYVIIDTGGNENVVFGVYGGTSQGRVTFALLNGTQVTLAAGLLWGIGAFLHSRSNQDRHQ